MVVLLALPCGNKKLAALAGLSGLKTNEDTLLGGSKTKSFGANEGLLERLVSPRWVDTLPVFATTSRVCRRVRFFSVTEAGAKR